MSQNLPSAAVMIGALRINLTELIFKEYEGKTVFSILVCAKHMQLHVLKLL